MEKENTLYHRWFELVENHKKVRLEINEIKSILEQNFESVFIVVHVGSKPFVVSSKTARKTLVEQLKELNDCVLNLEEEISQEMKMIIGKKRMIREAMEEEQMSLKELFDEKEN